MSDSSGNGHTALVKGATVKADSSGRTALVLNGSGDSGGWADVAGPVIDTSTSFTVSVWVKLSDVTLYRTIVSVQGDQMSGFFLQLSDDTHRFSLRRYVTPDVTSAHVDAASSFTPQANTWYHLVGVQDVASGQLRLYANGALQASTAYSNPWRASGDLWIGCGYFSGRQRDFITGEIGGVAVFSRALTPAEVTALP